jgi:hypothetical protein
MWASFLLLLFDSDLQVFSRISPKPKPRDQDVLGVCECVCRSVSVPCSLPECDKSKDFLAFGRLKNAKTFRTIAG